MFTLKKFVAACAVLLAICLPLSALAFDEVLTFRFNAHGEVEAIVEGTTTGCEPPSGLPFYSPKSITVTSSAILIMSPLSGGCFIPVTARAYQAVANLGHLTGETYQVTWQIGLVPGIPARSLSATLNMSDLLATVAAPAMSAWALCALALSISGVSLLMLRRRTMHSSR